MLPELAVMGSQVPRLLYVPEHDVVRSAASAREAIELARVAGLDPEPWEETATAALVSERSDGSWACRDFGLCAPRQNGKGVVLEIRELAGLFLFGEHELVHSAHLFSTSLEAFRRMRVLIESTPEFSRRVKSMRTANGDEGIELHGPPGRRISGGQRLKYRARTKGGAGRGLGGDFLALDEAMFLPEIVMGALLPVVSARPRAQVCYSGSAVDQTVHLDGSAFASIRRRGLSGEETQLGYVEHSAEGTLDDLDAVIDDPEAWAWANPGLGGRITLGAVRAERAALARRTFAVERLGIGDWPDADEDGDDESDIIDRDTFAARADAESRIEGPVTSFALDVSRERTSAAISAAGRRVDARMHIEVVEHRPGDGTGWLVDQCLTLQNANPGSSFRYDERSPAAALARKLSDAGVRLVAVNVKDSADACGQFVDLFLQDQVRHTGYAGLGAAIQGAEIKPAGESWAWSRTKSKADITPLVSCTLAAGGVAAKRVYGRAQW